MTPTNADLLAAVERSPDAAALSGYGRDVHDSPSSLPQHDACNRLRAKKLAGHIEIADLRLSID